MSKNQYVQWNFFLKDIRRMYGKDKWRLLIIIFSRSFVGILFYRIERSLFLLFGKSYRYVRVPFVPFLNLVQAYSNIDIHYKADIEGGLSILHPSLGVVVSGKLRCGEGLTLVGGNVIGVEAQKDSNHFYLGENCQMGANASIIGPIILGPNIKIGAQSCVVHNFENGEIILGGIPAKSLKNHL